MHITRKNFVAIGVAALAAVFSVATPAQQASSETESSTSNQVHSISLPQYSPDVPPGPGRDAFRNSCLSCHSARYVTMQPHFSKQVWTNEVQKMITAYGAPIAPKDKDAIVDYLVSIRGTAEAGASAPPQAPSAPK